MKKKNNFKNVKYLFYGILLLFIFHFETLSIGTIKLSHLWKGALLCFLLFKIFSKKRKFFFVYKPLIWLALLQLVNIELFNNTFNAVFLFGTTLMLPLIGIYVLRFSPKQLETTLLFFASFFIFAFVPYELDLLASYGDLYELTGYGVEEFGIIGPFQGAHAASTALAGSFLVVLYFWFTNSFNRVYLSLLLILGFYFLIFTYVRTGMLMVIIGVLPMLIYFSKKDVSTRFRLIFIGGLFSILISGWVLSNETLMDRITGKRINKVETESFEDLGSGRGQIYLYSIDIFLEANPFEQLFGMGQSEQLKRMKSKLGLALIPHNGFLLILLNNGVLGLFVFLAFLRKSLVFYRALESSDRVRLQGLLYAYIIMIFFQNYDLIYVYLVLVLSVAYSYKKMHVVMNKNITKKYSY